MALSWSDEFHAPERLKACCVSFRFMIQLFLEGFTYFLNLSQF